MEIDKTKLDVRNIACSFSCTHKALLKIKVLFSYVNCCSDVKYSKYMDGKPQLHVVWWKKW